MKKFGRSVYLGLQIYTLMVKVLQVRDNILNWISAPYHLPGRSGNSRSVEVWVGMVENVGRTARQVLGESPVVNFSNETEVYSATASWVEGADPRIGCTLQGVQGQLPDVWLSDIFSTDGVLRWHNPNLPWE